MRLALVQFSSNFGGSTISGEMIIKGCLDWGWDVDVFFGFDGPFVARVTGERCSAAVVPHKNWLRSAGLGNYVRNLWTEHRSSVGFERAFKERRPDLVYVNSLVSYAAASAAKRLGIPVVWHLRELFADAQGELAWPAAFAKGWVRRRISSLASKIIVNSSAVAENVFGPESRVEVEKIPNAIPPAFFVPRNDQSVAREALNLPVTGPLVGLPGTLRRVKGHGDLFRAIPMICERVPDCHFAITGAIDSPFGQSIVDEAQSAPLAGRVSFTGAVDDMVSFYHACDVCCLPSASESFGRTAIECFATRTPLVSTDVGGLKEVVRHGENGLIIPVGDERALAEAVMRLLTQEEISSALVERAAAEACERYTERVYLDRIGGVIKEALETKNRS